MVLVVDFIVISWIFLEFSGFFIIFWIQMIIIQVKYFSNLIIEMILCRNFKIWGNFFIWFEIKFNNLMFFKFVHPQNLVNDFPSLFDAHLGNECLVPWIGVIRHAGNLQAVDLKRQTQARHCDLFWLVLDDAWIQIEILEKGNGNFRDWCLADVSIVKPRFDCVEIVEEILKEKIKSSKKFEIKYEILLDVEVWQMDQSGALSWWTVQPELLCL